MNKWTKDLGLKLASVLVALVLFVYVQSQANLNGRKSVTYKVRLLGENPKGFKVSWKPATVTTTAEGSPDDINTLTALLKRDSTEPNKLIAYLELGNLSEGTTGTFDYQVRIQRQDEYPELHLSWSRPDHVSVTIEPEITLAKPVVLERANLPRGYSLKQAGITPDSVNITGTKEAVSRVAEVRALIDLKDYKPGAQYPKTHVDVLDSRMVPVPPTEVVVDPETVSVIPVLVDAGARQRNLLVSPVWSGEPAFGYKVKSYSISPNQVLVTGDPDALNAVVSLETQAVDIKGASADLVRHVQLKPKDGIDAPRRSIKVTVRIVPDPTAQAAKPPATTPAKPPAQ